MDTTGPNDAELVALARAGNRDAFEPLYDRHARMVRAVVAAVSRDWPAVEDMTQETFLRAYRNLGRLEEPPKFGDWVVGIARKVGRERRRTLRRDRHEYRDPRMTETAATTDGKEVVLSVHNEGAPIPQDVLPTIFDPLVRYATRESAARRSPGSVGLGLYIVREIVVAKGGTMEVASTAQEGTTFTVRIPRILPIEGDNRDDAKAAR